MEYLPDLMDYGLKLVFVGYNPGMRSARLGHHYSGRSNRFWKLLHESGLTPVRLEPEEDYRLLELGIGSTNIVSRPTRAAGEISKAEYARGALVLRQVLEKYRPGVACYLGAYIYRAFSGKKPVVYGLQAGETIKGVMDYVCTSPSGLNRTPFSRQLECFVSLRELLKVL